MRQIAARHYGVTVDDIMKPKGKRFLSKPRWAIYLALHKRKRSYAHIGRWMNRNHASIIYGVQQAQYYMERDPDFRDLVERLTAYSPEQVAQEVVNRYIRKEREDAFL